MVNYCCVNGCGRNSRRSKHLNYYSLPKERERQIEWLKAGGREDLLERSQDRLTHRFCSRHFPHSSIKNKHLCGDAMPTLFLPGTSFVMAETEQETQHEGIICDNCKDAVDGFRYKCLSCVDYDLCAKCESMETHANHHMLRIPKPIKFKTIDKLIRNWRQLSSSDHVTASCFDNSDVEVKSQESNSSDDEPITKYSKHYDSGIDLSDDVKKKIRNEVTRVLSIKDDDKKKRKVKNKRKMGDNANKWSKRPKTVEVSVEPKNFNVENVPETVFVDEEVNVKTETSTSQDVQESNVVPIEQHLMHVKLSDDLTELMIEIPGTNEKTVYKY